jgi:hypothetical protein
MPRVLNYKRDGLPPGAVYSGRLMPRYGLLGSKWHNPYKVGRDGTRRVQLRVARRGASSAARGRAGVGALNAPTSTSRH